MKNSGIGSAKSFELACDIEALTKKEMEHVMEVSKEIFGLAVQIQELADGYELSFSNGSVKLIRQLAEFMALESLCCPFIKHTLIIEPNRGGAFLQLTGEENVKEFILSELKRELPNNIIKIQKLK